MNERRFVIVPKRKGEYVIPVIETRTFDSPKFLGSYCSDKGDLWTTLNDGVRIFEDESLAKSALNKLIHELIS